MKPIIKGSYHTLALPYVQLVFFLMIMPFVNEKDEMKKTFIEEHYKEASFYS
ncbi:hypothetical protein QFZ73_003279 [Peribacillus sp. V2I11]|nr:hypothetical protein [Peribacillus sp. V2I11]